MSSPKVVLAHEPNFRIGKAEVRPATREVVVDGRATVIEPRVMQVLIALHRAEGVVSRDDLMASCWDGRIVGEDALNRVLSRLRHCAQHAAGGAFRVETITRVGYRLVSTDEPPAALEPAPRSKREVDRRGAIMVGLAATGLAAGGLAWSWSRPELPPRAQELMERGREQIRAGTQDQLAAAVGSFREATEVAPTRAEPWGALAYAAAQQASVGPPEAAAMGFSRAVAAADRALTFDPDNGDALTAKLMSEAWRLDELQFERRIREVIRRAPDTAVAYLMLSSILYRVGRTREALSALDRYLAIEGEVPRSQAARAYMLWTIGRVDEADALFDELVDRWPRHVAVWFSRLKFLMFSGQAERALAMLADTVNAPVGVPSWNFEIMRVQANGLAQRTPETVRPGIAESLRSARIGSGFAENGVLFTAAVGAMDEAFAIAGALFFNRGFTVARQRFSREQGSYGSGRIATSVLFEAPTRSMRSDPRFAALVQDLGLERYWKASGSQPDYRT